MSVPEGEREDGKFTLPIRALALSTYTIHITSNEKVFRPEFQEALTNDIVETAKNIYMRIQDANDTPVRVGTTYHRRDWIERVGYQREAYRNAKRLLRLIDMAKPVFHLSSKRVKYWGGLTREVKNRISGWIESDRQRFEP